MKTIKPQMLSLVTRSFEVDRRFYLGISTLLFCDIERGSLLSEVALWKFAAEALGKDAAVDVGIPKSRAEYLVVGSVYTPRGEPQQTCPVTVRIGGLEKTLYVIGDRHWKDDQQSTPGAFTTMPIDWEHAFGGPTFERNPLGKGAAPVETEYGPVQFLPNIEQPGKMITTPRQRPEPAGFRPIDITWPQRLEKAGTYDQRWLEELFPGFARDIDWTIHNIAPTDQQQDDPFIGNEEIEILNMHPAKPMLKGRLPGYKARVFVTQRTPTEDVFLELSPKLNTVWLIPDQCKAILVFQSKLETLEDDASDVLHLVLAAEALDQDKGVAHYQKVLEQRLDKEKGALYALRDGDLLPAYEEAPESKDEVDEAKRIFAVEGLRAQNLERRQREEIEQARARVVEAGLDPDEHGPGFPGPPEPMPEDPVERFEVIQKKIEDAKVKEKEVRAQLDEKLAALEPAMREAGIDPADIRAETQTGQVGPPTFTAEGELARIKGYSEDCRAMGYVVEEIEEWLRDEELHGKWRQMEQSLKDAYVQLATHQQPAPRLSKEESAAQREAVIQAYLAGEPFAYRDLTGVDLSGLDLRGADFRNGWLESANLGGANLEGASFAGAVLARADLTGAVLAMTDFSGANLGEAKLGGVDARGRINLSDSILMKADLRGADLHGADLSRSNLMEALFENTRLEGITAMDVNIMKTDMRDTSFAGATLGKVNFLEVDLTGVDFSGATLEQIAFVMCKGERMRFVNAEVKHLIAALCGSLAEADFQGARVSSINLRGCDLRGSDLSGAAFSEADLSEAALIGARLYRFVGKDAMMIRADLRDADLTSANLMGANLSKADIRGTRLIGANLHGANFGRVRSDEATHLTDALQTKVTVHPVREA